MRLLFLLFVISVFNSQAQSIFSRSYTAFGAPGKFIRLNSGEIFISGGGNYNALLIKTDSSANLIWGWEYWRPHDGTSIFDLIENDSDILIAGSTYDTVNANPGTYRFKCLLANIDTATGNITNSIIFGNAAFPNYEDNIYKIIKSSDGKFIAVGTTGEAYSPVDSIRALLLKFDANLNIIWANYFSCGLECSFGDLKESPDGNLYITGYVLDSIDTYDNDAILVKADSAGNILWSKRYDSPGNEVVARTILLDDSKIYLSGGIIHWSLPLFFSSFICELDTSGNLIWFNRYTKNAIFTIGKLFKRNSNEFVLYSSEYLCIVDSTGTIINGKIISPTVQHILNTGDNGLMATSQGGMRLQKFDSLYNACSTSNTSYSFNSANNISVLSNSLIQQTFVPEYKGQLYQSAISAFDSIHCQTSTLISEQSLFSENTVSIIFPNPVSEILPISILRNTQDKENYKLKIINMTGSEVLSKEILLTGNETEITLNLDFLPPGFYLIGFNEINSTYKKIIKF